MPLAGRGRFRDRQFLQLGQEMPTHAQHAVLQLIFRLIRPFFKVRKNRHRARGRPTALEPNFQEK
jgi:hypothetical protein